ncbi:MAG: cysteine dioxygenase family protein [Vicingaceae bacterium]
MKAISHISSIHELEQALKNHQEHGYLNIMKAIEIPYDEFEKHFTWKEEHYTRNSIIKNDDYELLVICWERAQDSPIHDYDSEDAWIHILRGQLKEEQFKKNEGGELERVSTVTLGVKDFSYISGHVGLHRYINSHEGRTVSLHLYVKPLEKWNEYDEALNAFKVRHIGYDS